MSWSLQLMKVTGNENEIMETVGGRNRRESEKWWREMVLLEMKDK